MLNGHALVKEAGIRSEDENRAETAALRVIASLRSALRKARLANLGR